MYFSCNGSTWSSPIAYGTSYSSFNIKTDAGCVNAEGDKNVYLKVQDTAGNYSGVVQTSQFVLDQTAPASNSIAVNSWTGLATYTNDSTPQFDLASTGAYQMKWGCDGSNYSSYESYAASRNVGAAVDWNIKPSSATNGCGTSDGSRTVYAVFKDQAGNEASAVNTGSFKIDQVAPVVSDSSPANDYNYSTPDPSLTSTSVEDTSGVWKCFARIGSGNPPSSPLVILLGSVQGDTTTCTFSGLSLSEGVYYWDVNAVDNAGNWSSYSTARKFTRDNTAPAYPDFSS
ncbi:MAG: hypothetical protein HZC29_00230, partial [Thaumarchaeota archaeon]|nr:hypothetical protein [Nitrososphaerota archaeon]